MAAALGEMAALCARLAQTPGRLDKRDQVADYLRALSAEDLGRAVPWLTGHPFATSDARVLNVRGLPLADGPGGPPLALADVAEAFAAAAQASGSGARRARTARLAALAARAGLAERDLLRCIITGEMRTGVSDGLMLEAIARASGAPAAAVRRAALLLGDLSAVARAARDGGPAALAQIEPRLFLPLLPMLAEPATDLDEVLLAHGGRSAMEFKYDGARIQVHADLARVAIWSRGLSDVTASLPDVVAVARGELAGAPFILDGEVVARDTAGRPLPFQELMRRFRRRRGVEAHAEAMPVSIHFFDCLMAEGRALIDQPSEARWAALGRVTGGRHLAERRLVTSADEARALEREALDAGHEGLVAKDLRSLYEPGSRGKRWFKVKGADTLDCVIVAADRGSGRRVGWLSNYHLAVRDGEGWAEVGKTFKGLTDAELEAMTRRLWALVTADDGYTVRVRPDVVVEIAHNEVQRSPTYPSGFALRFARIARVREDKRPADATALEEVRARFERQFETKGRDR